MLRFLRTKVENRPFVDEMGIKPRGNMRDVGWQR